jgi:hypothetical protein
MIEKWLDNLEKKIRIFFPYESINDGIIELRKHAPTYRSGWIGAYSISCRKAKIYKIWYPLVVWRGYTLITTEIAKFLIMLNNPPTGYRRITVDLLEQTPPPLYADPSLNCFEGAYIDIKSCYYTLIKKLWGIKYCRNNWLGFDKEIGSWHVPEKFEDILKRHKQIRNAIYGLLRAKHGIFWKIEDNAIKIAVRNIKNNIFYPDVPLAILDITHAIATIAVKTFNARYFAIDGAIIPCRYKDDFCEFLINLGFKYGIKCEGWTIIKNFYAYRCGDKKTLTFNSYPFASEPQSNLIFSLSEAEEILAKFKPFLVRNTD